MNEGPPCRLLFPPPRKEEEFEYMAGYNARDLQSTSKFVHFDVALKNKGMIRYSHSPELITI